MMTEEQLEDLVLSHGLEQVLIDLDLDPAWVLKTLIDLGHINEEDVYDIYY